MLCGGGRQRAKRELRTKRTWVAKGVAVHFSCTYCNFSSGPFVS